MSIEKPMFPQRAESVDSFCPQSAIDPCTDGRPISESAKPVQGMSLRMALEGLSVLPAIGLPAAAAAEPDPIFAAIQTCRVAKLASDEAYARVNWLRALAEKKFGDAHRACKAYVDAALGCDEDDYTNGPSSTLWDAYQAFAKTVPTTLPGLLAILVFAEEIVAARDSMAIEDGPIFSTLASAASALIGRAA